MPSALAFVRLKKESVPAFVEVLRGADCVRRFLTLTGEWDGLVELEVTSLEELAEFASEVLGRFEGMQASNLHVVLKRWRP